MDKKLATLQAEVKVKDKYLLTNSFLGGPWARKSAILTCEQAHQMCSPTDSTNQPEK
jgi:hypothetical protein